MRSPHPVRPVTLRGVGDVDLWREEYKPDLGQQIAGLSTLAAMVRQNIGTADSAIPLGAVYCDQRAKVDRAKRVDGRLLLELDLADHSVDWDLVNLSPFPEGAKLRRRFLHITYLPPGSPLSPNPGLRLHRLRSGMVEATKRRDWRKAVRCGHAAWIESSLLLDDGLLVGDYALECRQQIALGLAGAWVKQAETCLLVMDRDHCALAPEIYISEALRWSERATSLLTALATNGLPNRRGVDGRIGTVTWTGQTPTLLLRAELTALTAIQSGLCRRNDLDGVCASSAITLGEMTTATSK
jgi:hypothetical protein